MLVGGRRVGCRKLSLVGTVAVANIGEPAATVRLEVHTARYKKGSTALIDTVSLPLLEIFINLNLDIRS